jgi:hypothetical protein
VWSYTSTPQYIFMAWCWGEHRDNFTFSLPFTAFFIRCICWVTVVVTVMSLRNLYKT